MEQSMDCGVRSSATFLSSSTTLVISKKNVFMHYTALHKDGEMLEMSRSVKDYAYTLIKSLQGYRVVDIYVQERWFHNATGPSTTFDLDV